MRRRWLLIGGIVVTVAIGTAVAIVVLQGTGRLELTTASAAPAQDASSVNELAERLLSPPYPGVIQDGRAPTVRLAPGQLAPGLPLDVPAPPGGRVVGSAVREGGNGVLSADVVIDAPGGPRDALAYFEHALPTRGWTAPPTPSKGAQQGGFQPTTPVVGRTFCKGPTGPWLGLTAAAMGNATTDVRLHIDSMNPGPCAGPAAPPPGPMGMEVLPPLHAPDSVPLQISGVGFAANRWASEASAETDKSVVELEAHFARQLEAAGWKRVAGGATGPMAWSTWKVPRDGDWAGFLFALESPGAHRRAVYVRAESATSMGFGYATQAASMAVPPPAPPPPPAQAVPPHAPAARP